MKAVIVISSIFYILGLKISNKIDIFKHTNPVDKIITHKISPGEPANSVYFKNETQIKTEADTLKSGGISEEELQKSK